MKPFNISTREFIIKQRMNDVEGISEKEMDLIIVHQFENMAKRFIDNNSLEISGFGKFLFNEKKALNKLSEYDKIISKFQDRLNKNISEEEIIEIQNKIESINISVQQLKQKLK